MKHLILTTIAVLTLASPSRAQEPASDVLTKYLQRAYAAVAKDLVAVVELMPEQDFGFRPAGVVPEVRSFGAIVRHVIEVNSWVCSMGEGKPDPLSSPGSAPMDKARLTELLADTNARCTSYLATLSDAVLNQVVTTRSGGRDLEAVRGNAIIFAVAHANEHYGNLVTYLRAKGLVPPAAASQASFLSLRKTDR